ncbi:MAG: NADH-quinone oxidoreductase subunit J [Bacteroidota bacterium]
MTEYIFYFLSFLALISAVMVVASKNPVHSVLYLIITFFAIAGHYVLLNAQFLAAVHVIVYAGAIMVLFLYVIMLLNLNKEAEPHKSNLIKFAAVLSGGALLTVLVAALKGVDTQTAIIGGERNIGLVKNLGKILFTEYLFPFEVSSVLFLAAMVGAVMLGKNEPKP